jgi:hypothetical protein
LLYPGHSGSKFTIRLSYHDGEHPTHLSPVFSSMPVSGLRYNIFCLLRIDSLLFLFVGPSWESLDHCGTITDHCLPGTTQPCPFSVSSSALVTALSSPHGSSLVSRLRSGSPLGLSVPPSSVFDSFSVPSASLLAGTDSLSSNFTTFVSDLARSASSLVGADSTSSIFSSALPVSELPALPLVSSAPFLSSPVFPDSSLGFSELPTSQCGPSILLSSPIVDQILDNAVINESPDCVPPVSAFLLLSSGDVSAEVSPSIIADCLPTKGGGFRATRWRLFFWVT